MKKSRIHIAIVFICFILSCKRTSTPRKYLNNVTIKQSEYESDKKQLAVLTKFRRDSIRASSKTPEGKSLEIYIDTIFYNTDNRIVFLSITKKENPYALNKDKISYSGECYIGLKEEESKIMKILHRLKYGSTSAETDGFERVKKSNRNIYLTEMEFIDCQFNINDTRFWTSKVWNK